MQTKTAHFETPTALRHDAHTFAEDVRALVSATSEIADEKIATSRERILSALASGRDLVSNLQKRTVEGARVADECVRQHPYQSMLVAFGIGAVLGCLLIRRD